MPTVLIVDDESDLASLVEFNLQKAGLRDKLGTAREALQTVRGVGYRLSDH